MLEGLKRIVVITGHYGSGKTNLAVNLALESRRAGEEVVLADLDIVNPYFRSADFSELMEMEGIELVAPIYAGSNLDIPALTARLDALLDSDRRIIIDVGGDDAGAAALGRYSAMIEAAGGCDMLYVVNGYRYLTRSAGEAEEILEEIERAARLRASAVVNNSNLAGETTAQDIADKAGFAKQVAESYHLPLLCHTAQEDIAEEVKMLLPGETVCPVRIYVKKLWEKAFESH